MNELKIHGHSGCNLKIIETGGKLYVEKSCKESYIPRLKKQYEKQYNAADNYQSNGGQFKIPYPSWKNDSIYMPYVHSMSFVEYFERASLDDINKLITAVEQYILTECMNSDDTEVKVLVFTDKVKSVYDNAQKNILFNQNHLDTIKHHCDIIINHLLSLGDTINLPIGACHGDMTFSNILFQNSGKHFLIDFLDSFVETPLQDIVKIRQDTLYGWSLMMTDQKYNNAHVKSVMKYIDKRIYNDFRELKIMEHYDMLQYINILRIVPYVKDIKVYNRLIEILNSITL